MCKAGFMYRQTSGDINHRVPIIPHEVVGGRDCWGCLVVQVRGDQADILCNECVQVIETVATARVEEYMAKLVPAESISSATCAVCGALNTFAGFEAILAFVCSECGESNEVNPTVQ